MLFRLPFAADERRTYQRTPVDQAVTLRDGGHWIECRITDVSAGGAAFQSDLRPAVNKEIVVRIDRLGLFACRILRHTEEGFAARFEAADFSLGSIDSDLARMGAETGDSDQPLFAH